MDDQIEVDLVVVGIGVEGCLRAARAAIVDKQSVLCVGRVGERYGSQHGTLKGIDFVPLLLSMNGRFAKELIDLKAAEHLSFIPVDSISVLFSDGPVRVPFKKEHVMLEPSISLADKRRLMSLMTTNFDSTKSDQLAMEWLKSLQLSDKLIKNIMYGICMIDSEETAQCITVNSIIERLSSFAKSLPQPLLYPVYGSSEIAQALTRVAAVHGAMQVLDQPASNSIIYDKKVVSVIAKETVECDQQIYLCHYAHCKSDLSLFGESGVRLYVYPPENHATTLFCLQLNETTKCCRSGYILNFWCFGGAGLDLSRFADRPFYQSIEEGTVLCSRKEFVYF